MPVSCEERSDELRRCFYAFVIVALGEFATVSNVTKRPLLPSRLALLVAVSDSTLAIDRFASDVPEPSRTISVMATYWVGQVSKSKDGRGARSEATRRSAVNTPATRFVRR